MSNEKKFIVGITVSFLLAVAVVIVGAQPLIEQSQEVLRWRCETE